MCYNFKLITKHNKLIVFLSQITHVKITERNSPLTVLFCKWNTYLDVVLISFLSVSSFRETLIFKDTYIPPRYEKSARL